MYTSVSRIWLRHALIQLAITVFFAVFGAVYEYFSHEVYSYFMIYAFAVPLLLGVLPYSVMAYRKIFRYKKTSVMCWNAGIITLTTGSAFKGVLDIYGTSNSLLLIYPAAGILIMITAGILYTVLKETPEGEI